MPYKVLDLSTGEYLLDINDKPRVYLDRDKAEIAIKCECRYLVCPARDGIYEVHYITDYLTPSHKHPEMFEIVRITEVDKA